jgi:hypothetical protein
MGRAIETPPPMINRHRRIFRMKDAPHGAFHRSVEKWSRLSNAVLADIKSARKEEHLILIIWFHCSRFDVLIY